MNYEHLLGISWAYGTADCFSLFQRFYKDNWDIEIPNIAHPLLWEVTHPDLDIVRSNIKNAGFAPVDVTPRSILPGDALLMQLGAGVKVLNHCAVYIGFGSFIHQPFRAVSRKDLWSGEWKNATMVVARNSHVPAPPPRPLLDVRNLLPPTIAKRYNGK